MRKEKIQKKRESDESKLNIIYDARGNIFDSRDFNPKDEVSILVKGADKKDYVASYCAVRVLLRK